MDQAFFVSWRKSFVGLHIIRKFSKKGLEKQNALEGTMQPFLLSASHSQLYDEEFHCYVSFGGTCSDLSMLEQSERSLGRGKMQ